MFRAQMLTEMASMSVEDGMVMQLHPGSFRNHNPALPPLRPRHGRGWLLPDGLRARPETLARRFGNEPNFTFILFTLDETSYSRELARRRRPLSGAGSGPPGGSSMPGGHAPRRELTDGDGRVLQHVGFNDDAGLSVDPARHDMARRVDCAYLANLVVTHRLDEDEAHEVAHDLAYRLAKEAYKL